MNTASNHGGLPGRGLVTRHVIDAVQDALSFADHEQCGYRGGMKLRASVVVMFLAGCGPQTTDTEGTTDAGSSSTGAGSSTSEASVTSSPTTGESTTGGSACAPGPVAGEVACQPPGAAQTYWALSFYGPTDEVLDTLCSVEGVDDDGELTTIRLACAGDAAVLELFSKDPHVNTFLAVGAMVQLQWTTLLNDEVPDQWFAVRDPEGRLLIAGLKNTVFPELAPLTIAPLTIDVRGSDCDGVVGGCHVIQRAALSVAMDEDEVLVFDGNVGQLGELSGFTVVAGSVTRELCYMQDCGFNYEPWSADALIVFSPEG